MICLKCKNDGVENEALGKKFWYCRTCKDEIVPLDAPATDLDKVNEDIAEILKAWSY